MSERRTSAGFSLVEVLCALAIVAISLVVLYRGLGSSQVAASYLEAQLGARLIAQSILADERQAPNTTADKREGESGMYKWRFAIEPASVAAIGDLPSAYRLYRLTVEVTWQPRGRLVLDTLKLAK